MLLICVLIVASFRPALQQLTTANNLFAASLYKTVFNTTNKNFILSPFASETALAFLQSGCKAATAQEIHRVLHFSNKQQIRQSFKALSATLKKLVATKLFVRKNLALKPNFRKAAIRLYNAYVENVDFRNAKATMNEWIEKKTKKRIANIIKDEVLTSSTRGVLLNTISFRSEWLHPFQTSAELLFYRPGSDAILVDVMALKHTHFFKFCDSTEIGAKVLEMNLTTVDSSVTFVLPNVTANIDIEKVLALKCPLEGVDVKIPKFKTESRVNLKNVLRYMGVSRVFDGKVADLSLMGGKKGGLYVNEALQKVYVDVGEGGIGVGPNKKGLYTVGDSFNVH